MTDLKLTVALEHYDRHLPLLEGKVAPEGIELQVTYVSAAEERHERMLHHQEWDACELSLSSYLMARARGIPLAAIPVFPRRLFSQSQMYVNRGAGIHSPRDLIGKKVGLRSFQTTLSVLAKGDLQHEYDVPPSQVTWVTSTDEPVPFESSTGIRMERAPSDKDIETMLVDGEIQALMVPLIPRPFVEGAPQVARLFENPRAEEVAYYQRNGFHPIMHLVAIRAQLIADHPWVAMSLFRAFEQAKEISYRYYDDPNWSHLAWASLLALEERKLMGADPWPNGVARNRQNLERFIQYELDQGLIDRRLEVEELFTEPTLNT